MLTSLGERRLLHWGVSLVGPNRFCSPTTDLLIIIIILIFIIILILSILIIPIILIIFIILIILFVLMIVVINSLLLPSLSSSSVSFIVLVSNLINIKRLALFVTCSNSKKPRETVAAFRLNLANPPLRLPPYPSPASFRTSPLASSFSPLYSPNSVSTLRGSYGKCKRRSLIRVLTLGRGIFPVNFHIKWLL